MLAMAAKPLVSIFAIFWQSTATIALRAFRPFIGKKKPGHRTGLSME